MCPPFEGSAWLARSYARAGADSRQPSRLAQLTRERRTLPVDRDDTTQHAREKEPEDHRRRTEPRDVEVGPVEVHDRRAEKEHRGTPGRRHEPRVIADADRDIRQR